MLTIPEVCNKLHRDDFLLGQGADRKKLRFSSNVQESVFTRF